MPDNEVCTCQHHEQDGDPPFEQDPECPVNTLAGTHAKCRVSASAPTALILLAELSSPPALAPPPPQALPFLELQKTRIK